MELYKFSQSLPYFNKIGASPCWLQACNIPPWDRCPEPLGFRNFSGISISSAWCGGGFPGQLNDSHLTVPVHSQSLIFRIIDSLHPLLSVATTVSLEYPFVWKGLVVFVFSGLCFNELPQTGCFKACIFSQFRMFQGPKSKCRQAWLFWEAPRDDLFHASLWNPGGEEAETLGAPGL